MKAKKERELFVHSVERHLERKNRILGGYRTLSELIGDSPAALLIDWVIAEDEAHRNILCAVMKDLKGALHEQKGKGSKTDGSGLEDRILFWTDKLRHYEERFAADCLYLKSQACWEGGELFDAMFDAMFMDSQKHQKLLLAVKEMVK